jgi:hypothetical protein
MARLEVPMDASRFANGLTWTDYMAQIGEPRTRTEAIYRAAALSDEERRFFGALSQVRYAVMLAENWCGDVHRNSPALARICEAMPACELRVFFRDQNLDLADAYLNNGYRSIPVIAFFDRDWTELGHWIERPAVCTRLMFAIRARTLETAPADRQDAAMVEFRKQVHALYEPPHDLWKDTIKEIRLVLETRTTSGGPPGSRR